MTYPCPYKRKLTCYYLHLSKKLRWNSVLSKHVIVRVTYVLHRLVIIAPTCNN